MDTYLSMKVFCQVVHSGSFTRAAEQLDLSISMASKHVAHLEKSLHTRLLYRSNRRLSLTEAGASYYRDCLLALDILEQAANRAASGTSRPQGQLRVSLPVWFANPLFAGWLAEYRALYPDVSLILTLTNRNVDLNSEGEDLALRMSQQLADQLIAKPLAQIPFRLVATPACLKQHGLPQQPQDLAAYPAILPSYTDLSQLRARHRHQDYPLPLQAGILSNNTLMLYQLVCAGAGIGYLPEWLVRDDIRSGRLQWLLSNYQTTPVPLYAVYTQREFLSAKVRSFIDFIAQKTATL